MNTLGEALRLHTVNINFNCLLLLTCLKLCRSSKFAVAMATGGLVPPLLEPLGAPQGSCAPILRAKLLEVIRVLYEHYPRPKEFIIKYKIQVRV